MVTRTAVGGCARVVGLGALRIEGRVAPRSTPLRPFRRC